MIEFGKTLRVAREAKGYTVSQIAEMTHIKSSVVEGLENEDFSMIAAPIYGRGFVKLYCEVVGLDAKPLVDEYMAIVNGDREIVIKERQPDADPQDEPIPPSTPEPTLGFEPEPEPEPELEPEPDLFRTPAPAPAPAAHAPNEQPSFARFAAPIRENSSWEPPTFMNPRLLILAGCIAAFLVLLAFGIRMLYRATAADTQAAQPPATSAPAAPKAPATAAASTPAVPKAPATAAAGAPAATTAARTQQKIPQLYID